MTFERRLEDNPTFNFYDAPPHAPGAHPTVKYGEGVFVGYRWYTTHADKPQPLFAFGHGLSYSTFTFANLKVTATGNTAEPKVTVTFDVTNTGGREAAEVAQVYVGEPGAAVPRPAKELKGFKKLRLMPGKTGHVSIDLDRRAFAWYDTSLHDWKVDAGKFTISVGNASDATPLSAAVQLSD
jgi:beta-glucosidase